jgi:putative Ca2+/H+ antiporter (TMEM165/GDT1 family)
MLKVLAIFVAVFLAELGDKTQLATLLFATDSEQKPLTVFLAAAGALFLSTALAVLVGTAGTRLLEAIPVRLFAGLGFVPIGVWTIIGYFRAG